MLNVEFPSSRKDGAVVVETTSNLTDETESLPEFERRFS
jgi:hypothetical protein